MESPILEQLPVLDPLAISGWNRSAALLDSRHAIPHPAEEA